MSDATVVKAVPASAGTTRGKPAADTPVLRDLTRAPSPTRGGLAETLSDFDAGFLVGILVGEGHFGGDGRQAQITLRMHTDHEATFSWLTRHLPGGRLYGPYDHSGRRYYQWMARGPFLRNELIPLLDRWLGPQHSDRVHERYQRMKARYGLGAPAVPAVPFVDSEGRGPTGADSESRGWPAP